MIDSVGVQVTQSSIPGTVSIHVSDDMTHQVLLLTKLEAERLRDILNEIAFDDIGPDEIQQKQKALTLYNRHALPTINRKAYEDIGNLVNPCFEFEIIQHIKNADGAIVESKSVGHL